MRTIVDTSVWSLALRRKAVTSSSATQALRSLIEHGLAVMLGPVRQEILSGIKHRDQFDRLSERLAAFDDLILETDDFVEAASLCNECLRRGIQASHTDFLIAAAAIRRDFAVLSADKDFAHIATLIPVKLSQVS